jgi:hypothetical protein
MYGQVQVSSGDHFKFLLKPVATEVFDHLPKSKTNFIHFEKDPSAAKALHKELSSVWKVNELIMVHYDDYSSGKYNKEYATFHPGKAVGGGTASYYMLTLPMNGAFRDIGYFILQEPSVIGVSIDYAPFVNWSITYLKASLKQLNDFVLTKKSHVIHTPLTTPDVKKVKDRTLLIPKEITNDIALKALKKYKYPYEVLSMAELEIKVKEDPSKYFVLSNVRYFSYNINAIINPVNSEFVYVQSSVLMRLSVIFGAREVGNILKAIKE